MPTGYTDAIKDDTTLAEFAIRCARAFGALILMRDDPLDAPVPDEFPPDDYYLKAVEDAKSRLAAVREWTLAEAAKDLERHNAEQASSLARCSAERQATRKRYERMLGLVKEWTPPTEDHKGLKKFMVDQIRSSLDWDCGDMSDYYKPFEGTPAQWKTRCLDEALQRLGYAEASYAEEVQRSKERTEWVKALRTSLLT